MKQLNTSIILNRAIDIKSSVCTFRILRCWTVELLVTVLMSLEVFDSKPLKTDINVIGGQRGTRWREKELEGYSLLVGVSSIQISSVPIVRV